MIDSGGGGGVNYQMQIVTSFLSLTCEIVFVTSFLSLTCEIVFVVGGITIGSLPLPPQDW